MRGFRHVYAFTLARRTETKLYRILTAVLALVLFLVPFIGLPALEKSAGEDEETDWSEAEVMIEGSGGEITDIFAANLTDSFSGDLALLQGTIPGFETAEITVVTDYAAAAAAAESVPGALILLLEEEEGHYNWCAVAPVNEGSVLTYDDANLLADALWQMGAESLYACLGITGAADTIPAAVLPTKAELNQTSAETEAESYLEILAMVLPYLNIMLVYFLVIYYGQSVAQSCIMEKSSKLMDTFLVSVDPMAMLSGKVLASVTAAIAQFAVWVAALASGIALGLSRAEAVHTELESMFVAVLQLLLKSGSVLQLPQLLIGIVLVCAGFLMYSALASIGGALAGKQEELSSTNTLFMLVLVVSFLLTLRTGIFADIAAGIGWYDLVPFTAVLITPSRILLGAVSLVQGALSILLTLAAAVLIFAFAGRLYRMMSLYKGSAPKPKELLRLLTSK